MISENYCGALDIDTGLLIVKLCTLFKAKLNIGLTADNWPS